MAFATVHLADYLFEAGEAVVRRIASSSFGHRGFCGECGTPLFMCVDHQPETIDFSVVTLDDPGHVRPGFHIFWASRVDWFQADDGLPKFNRFRANTRGLDGPEPPA